MNAISLAEISPCDVESSTMEYSSIELHQAGRNYMQEEPKVRLGSRMPVKNRPVFSFSGTLSVSF